MLKEFRDFAINGSAIDLRIGVAIGAALVAIVSSLTGDASLPITGPILDQLDLSILSLVSSNPNSVAVILLAAATKAVTASLTIGLFTNAVVKFAIVAFVLFLVVKGINTIRNEKAAASAA